MSIVAKRPMPFLLFFSGAAAAIAHKLNGRAGERHRRAAENKRIIVGRLSYRHGAPDGAWATSVFGE